MKFLKTVLLWILALQLLNMSICCETYWFYYNGYALRNSAGKQADPTETIVEWLVEMKMGQQDVFTYDNHNIDSKNTVKVIVCHIDQENQCCPSPILQKSSKLNFAYYHSAVPAHVLEILSPPPDGTL